MPMFNSFILPMLSEVTKFRYRLPPTEIRLDRDNYFSMPEVDSSGTGMAWHIVEHPLLVLTRAFMELRSGQTR